MKFFYLPFRDFNIFYSPLNSYKSFLFAPYIISFMIIIVKLLKKYQFMSIKNYKVKILMFLKNYDHQFLLDRKSGVRPSIPSCLDTYLSKFKN